MLCILTACGGGGGGGGGSTSNGTPSTPTTNNNSVNPVLITSQDPDVGGIMASAGISALSLNDVIIEQSASAAKPNRVVSCATTRPVLLVSTGGTSDVLMNTEAVFANPSLLGADPLCSDIIYVRQAQQIQALRDPIYRGRDMTITEAYQWNVLSAKLIDRVMKHFQDNNRSVTLLTQGFSSYLGMLWLEIGAQQPNVAVLTGGRVEMETAVVQRYTDLKGGQFAIEPTASNASYYPSKDAHCQLTKGAEYFCENTKNRLVYQCNALSVSATNGTATDADIVSWITRWLSWNGSAWVAQTGTPSATDLSNARTELLSWTEKANQLSEFDSNYGNLSNNTDKLKTYCADELNRRNNKLRLESAVYSLPYVTGNRLSALSLPFASLVTTDSSPLFGALNTSEINYLQSHGISVRVNAGYTDAELLTCSSSQTTKTCTK